MSKLSPIKIKGARTHNLKNIDVTIPRNSLVVVTGVSGSGKSSLVFDTLYAEGHRRYVESLSSYARQFLARMQKPDVDLIEGVSPAIAIEQRVGSANNRSTVGSITEVYDYLRLLFARVGKTYSPKTGKEVKSQNVSDVLEYIKQLNINDKVYIFTKILQLDRPILKELEICLQKGFTRLWINGNVVEIEELLSDIGMLKGINWDNLNILIDRFVINEELNTEDFLNRIADSVLTTFNEGQGSCFVQVNNEKPIKFSEAFESDGVKFEKPSIHLFNYNNPFGACPVCKGKGLTKGLDPQLAIPDIYISIEQGAISPWQGMVTYERFAGNFLKIASKYGFRNIPIAELNEVEKNMLWNGVDSNGNPIPKLVSLNQFYEDMVNSEMNTRRMHISKFTGLCVCKNCKGTRLRPEATYIKVNGYNIAQLLDCSISEFNEIFRTFQFNETDYKISERILVEISNRLMYLNDVGLGYLSLNRTASSLSGGETQRINLATSLGSNLTGSLYILDEPSIGLHPRDTDRLISVLKNLRNLGNTVVVVEHDETIMKNSNFLIDVGPLAGEHGGEIIFTGDYNEIIKDENSLTGKYLAGKIKINTPKIKKPRELITIKSACDNNLKNIDVSIPLEVMTVVTGVSGSGKTTLVKNVLYPYINAKLDPYNRFEPGTCKGLTGSVNKIKGVEFVSQSALNRMERSTPVTHMGAYDFIRSEFASTPDAVNRRLVSGHFSYNTYGGTCEECHGEGMITIPMQFLPDVKIPCDSCKGKRFKKLVLEVKFQGKNIYEVLEMTISEAVTFFSSKTKIQQKLIPLIDVGLGYIKLGQSVNTLSGGESQRLKLASFLREKSSTSTLYIFDEPTTGLHFHDVSKLISVLKRLTELGNTVLVIEHNLDVIQCADWIIDLGPEGGKEGGNLVFSGTPTDLIKNTKSHTAKYLKEKITGILN